MSTDRRRYRKTFFAWMIFFGICFLALVGYVASIPYFSPELPQVELNDVQWQTYTNSKLGFAFDYPDAYNLETREDDDVALRLDGSNLIVISHLTQQQADSRGLWADHKPVEDIELDGRAGKKYDYNHFDIFAGVHTISYVVPYKQKFLAIEFRTRRASVFESLGIKPRYDRELNEVEKKMLASFRF